MEQKDKVAAAGLTAGSAKAPSPTGHAIPQDRAPTPTDERARPAAPNPVDPDEGTGAVGREIQPSSAAKADDRDDPKGPRRPNNVRRYRIEHMMSKAELARRANLSVLTIDRVERGYGCRMDTKRKILEALGLSLAERVRVFGEEE